MALGAEANAPSDVLPRQPFEPSPGASSGAPRAAAEAGGARQIAHQLPGRRKGTPCVLVGIPHGNVTCGFLFVHSKWTAQAL